MRREESTAGRGGGSRKEGSSGRSTDERLHGCQQAVPLLEVDIVREVEALPAPALGLRLHHNPDRPWSDGGNQRHQRSCGQCLPALIPRAVFLCKVEKKAVYNCTWYAWATCKTIWGKLRQKMRKQIKGPDLKTLRHAVKLIELYVETKSF